MTNSWVDATIVSVSTVFVLWLATSVMSNFAKRMRWLTPHRHSRLSRGCQVVFGGLMLMAMMMPYLTMHHPLIAAALVGGAIFAVVAVGSRDRQLSHETQPPTR